jgi:hypothetical protein
MSAAIFNISPDQIVLAMDTLAMSGDTKKPCFFTTKFYLLPHIYGAMFATGVGNLATQWFVRLEHFLARDIHHLDEYVTPVLQELGKEFGLNDDVTTTIYHIGYSETEQGYVAFAYRSTNDFKSERLQYGFATKPPVPEAIATSSEDFIQIMEEQRAMDNALPPEKRVFIGGEIQLLVLQNKTMTIQTIHRFEDYEDLYDQMRDGVKRYEPACSEAPD